jgi:hypothetical protein
VSTNWRALRSSLSAITALALAMVLMTAPVAAVTYGELDGDRHPHVGLMVAQDKKGNPLWRCSGTLMSPTIFLTAGHCTEAPAAKVQIWFESDVEAGIPGNGYPFGGKTSKSGKPYTHPDYNPNAFYLRDIGVVVLDKPFKLGTYGRLPARDSLDVLKPSSKTTFTAVGYGLQRSNPVFVEAERVRMLARPHLVQINVPGYTGDFSLLLSNNANTGGTCFGDSGGPNFLGDSNVVAGITSYGNSNCTGTGGVYRVDRGWNLDWLASKFGLRP